jgi:3-dehydroquinate synthetase
MDTVLDICRWLLAQGADRDAVVWAVGGGVTTDLAGFAASIYKRGVRYANYPTTLLCQVDAGVGGKTGVNLDGYKNMVGVIKFPIYTRILPEALKTLPPRELRSGAAEMLKTFILDDAAHYGPAISTLSALYRKACGLPDREAELEELIAAAAAVKAAVVGRDPFEKGERRKLNLGHTFAHGLETRARQTGKDLTHGEAVAIGMVLAARLSERMGLAEPGLSARLKADFESCGLPTESPFGLDLLAEAMKKDKKADGGIVHFILPAAIGTVVEKDLTVAQALEKLKES